MSAFSGGEVDDKAQQAYELAYPNQAEEHTLHEHWVELGGSRRRVRLRGS